MQMVEEFPRRRGEIDREFPRLSAIEVSRALNALMEENHIVRIGNRGGARYALPNREDPAPVAGIEIHQPQEEAVPTYPDRMDTEQDTHEPEPVDQMPGNPVPTGDSDPLVEDKTPDNRRPLEEIIEELDESLLAESDGITMLRARYLAVLLRKLEEPGPPNAELMDHFHKELRRRAHHDGDCLGSPDCGWCIRDEGRGQTEQALWVDDPRYEVAAKALARLVRCEYPTGWALSAIVEVARHEIFPQLTPDEIRCLAELEAEGAFNGGE